MACVRNVLVIKNVLQLRSSAEERLLLGPRVPSWRRSHWDSVPVGPRSSGSKGIGKNGELAKMCRYQAPAGGPWRFDWPRPPPNESIESPGSAGVDGSAVNHPPPTGKEPIGVCILHSYSKVSPTIARNQVIAWCSSCAVVAVIALW